MRAVAKGEEPFHYALPISWTVNQRPTWTGPVLGDWDWFWKANLLHETDRKSFWRQKLVWRQKTFLKLKKQKLAPKIVLAPTRFLALKQFLATFGAKQDFGAKTYFAAKNIFEAKNKSLAPTCFLRQNIFWR